MTTGYEVHFYRHVELIARNVPDIRDALLLVALRDVRLQDAYTQDDRDDAQRLREQLLDGILIRHGVRKVER